MSKFLKEEAMRKLVQDLKNVEGVPTDSESLEANFHQHGVNMRYLGEVAKHFENNANFIHLKILLEKEVILRSAKHIFNEQIRESSNLYLSSVISHLLNMLLAPIP